MKIYKSNQIDLNVYLRKIELNTYNPWVNSWFSLLSAESHIECSSYSVDDVNIFFINNEIHIVFTSKNIVLGCAIITKIISNPYGHDNSLNLVNIDLDDEIILEKKLDVEYVFGRVYSSLGNFDTYAYKICINKAEYLYYHKSSILFTTHKDYDDMYNFNKEYKRRVSLK